MSRFVEFGLVRLLVSHTGEGHYEDNGVVTLSAGMIGTIIDVLKEDSAFEVEFMLRPPVFDDKNEMIENGVWHCITLKAHQISSLPPEEMSKMA